MLMIFERPFWIKQRDKVPSKLPAFLNALLFQSVLCDGFNDAKALTVIGGEWLIFENICACRVFEVFGEAVVCGWFV